MIYDFSDERLLKSLQNIHMNFKSKTQAFQQEMNDLVWQSKNERYVRIVQDMYAAYNQFLAGDFHNNVMQEWENSPSSFAVKARSASAGSDAVQRAKKMQQEVLKITDTTGILELVNKPDTSEPDMSSEYYDKMVESCKKYVGDLEADYIEAKKSINKLSGSNLLAGGLLGVCNVTYTTAIKYWKKQTDKLKNERDSFVNTLRSNQSHIDARDSSVEQGIADAVTDTAGNDMPEINVSVSGTASGTGTSAAADSTASGDSAPAGTDDNGISNELPDYIRRRLEYLINDFSMMPSNTADFRALARYLAEASQELVENFGEPAYYPVIEGLAKICESYFTYAANGLVTGDEWENVKDYEFYPCFVNRNQSYFMPGDFAMFDADKPETYIAAARMLQNQCAMKMNGQHIPSDNEIQDVARNLNEMLTNQTDLNQEKTEDFEKFSAEAVKMLNSIINCENFTPTDCSKYARVSQESGHYAQFLSYTQKFYERVLDRNKSERILVREFADIYSEFFGNYAQYIVAKNTVSTEDLQREMVQVSFDKGNNKYFDSEECWNTFANISAQTLQYAKYSADMMRNVANADDSQASNIIYAAYVNLYVIERIKISNADVNIETFLQQSCEKMSQLLNINISQAVNTGRYTPEACQIVLEALDSVVNEQGGVEKVNRLFENQAVYNIINNGNVTYNINMSQLSNPASGQPQSGTINLNTTTQPQSGTINLNMPQTQAGAANVNAAPQTQAGAANVNAAPQAQAGANVNAAPQAQAAANQTAQPQSNIYAPYGIDDSTINACRNYQSRMFNIVQQADNQIYQMYKKVNNQIETTAKLQTCVSKACSILAYFALGKWGSKSELKATLSGAGVLSFAASNAVTMPGGIAGAIAINSALAVLKKIASPENCKVYWLNRKVKNTIADLTKNLYISGNSVNMYLSEHYAMLYGDSVSKKYEGYYFWILHKLVSDYNGEDKRAYRNAIESAAFVSQHILDKNVNRIPQDIHVVGGVFVNVILASLLSTDYFKNDVQAAKNIANKLMDLYKNMRNYNAIPDVSRNPVSLL